MARSGFRNYIGGREVEMEVYRWAEGFSLSCEHMKQTHPYDMIVDGKLVEVKSAHISTNKDGRCPRYTFAINHKTSRNKTHNIADVIWLVLLDNPGVPVYSVPARLIDSDMLNIPADTDKSKHALNLVGFLRS